MAATILEGSAFNSWTHTFSLWCLNPAVIFREIADCSLSVILTSSYEQCEMQVHLEDNAKRCFIQHDKVFACCCTWRIMLRNPFLLVRFAYIYCLTISALFTRCEGIKLTRNYIHYAFVNVWKKTDLA
nr:Fanconi anemia group J protein homolog [Ipomoea batatas]